MPCDSFRYISARTYLLVGTFASPRAQHCLLEGEDVAYVVFRLAWAEDKSPASPRY